MFPAQFRRRWAPRRFLALLFMTCLAVSTASFTAAVQPTYASSISLAARALDAAATASVRADHALVAKARALRTCQIRHRKHCRSSQQALQQAGRKLNSSEGRLSHLARSRSRRGRSSSATRAPSITISGQTLSWNRPGNAGQFVFVRKVPGQEDQYSVINGASTTPPPVPGYTVRYSVRTNVSGSVWAAEKSISYAALTPPSMPPAETPTTTATETPTTTSTTPAPSTPILPPSTPPSNPQTAPIITVSGQTLTWVQIANVNNYVLVSKVPGQADQYTTVSSTSITPPAVPGATVHYSVRTAVQGSAWAPEVSIAYASSAPAGPSAPVLSVHGDTVSWGALPGVTSYTFATVHNPATTRETSYVTVTGTSYTPAEVPGQIVNYGLHARTPVKGPWAGEVSISYPAQTPPPPPPPSEEPPSSSSGSFGLPFAKGIDANLEGWGVNNLPEIASEMNSLGVNWEREDLAWESVERQRGVFNWTRFDQTVTAAKAQGITILPIVGYAPSWTSPTDSTAYAEFVKAAVARYGPGTSANLQWWELWNEPYFAYAWSGHTPEPEAYAKDVLAAAEAAKGVAPSVKLLVAADYQESAQTGGSSTHQTSWIDDMFTAAPTLGGWIDGVSVHPYGGDPATPLKETGGYLDASGVWGFQRIDTIHSKFLAHGVDVPFWITEEGWSTWDNSEETITHRYADLFPQIKLRPWIRALFPFGLREGTEHPTNDQAGYGLLRFGSWQPKPFWNVIQEGFKTLS